MDNIKAIQLLFDNGDNFFLNSDCLEDLYISNIDNEGNEMPYEPSLIKEKLYANLFILKLNALETKNRYLKRIKMKYDITEINIIFNNNKYLKFEVPSNAKPFDNDYYNEYEHIYENDNYFGILLSEHNLKYKENLFA